MITLVVEIEREGRWITLSTCSMPKPGGSISNRLSGERELLYFWCEEGHAVVARPMGWTGDLALGNQRAAWSRRLSDEEAERLRARLPERR